MNSLRVTITLKGEYKDFPHNPWPFSSIGSHTNTTLQDGWYFPSFFPFFFFFKTKDEPALTPHDAQESTMICLLWVWTNVNITQYIHCPKVLHLPLTTSTAASLGLSWGFHGGSIGKESACNAGDQGSIPGSGRSPGHGNSLQNSCLGNPMDRGAWWATVHEVTQSRIWLSD